MANTRSALLNVMVRATQKAGRALVRDFGEVEQLQVSRKGPADFVSTADHRSESILREELSHARPGYGFLMEEGGTTVGDDPEGHRWIIDPLDGTTNFLHGIPQFAVSVALERQGDLIAGVVFNPVADELFIAERGQGAFFNDRRLRVSGRRSLADCVLATGIPFLGAGDHGQFLRELAVFMPKVAGIRRCGSAALDLAWTAAGRFDGYWEANINAWDVAAGVVLVREAGGFASDMTGSGNVLDGRGVLAGNSHVHDQMLRALAEQRREASRRSS